MRVTPPEIEPLDGIENIFGYIDDATAISFSEKSRTIRIKDTRRRICWEMSPEEIEKVQRLSIQEIAIIHHVNHQGSREVTVLSFPTMLHGEYAFYALKEILEAHLPAYSREMLK